MVTEKEIVYSILNTLRGSHSDNNEMISTRLIRSWIMSSRANLLLRFTDNGRSISEENYQSATGVSFTKKDTGLFYRELPKIILFNKRTGIRIRTNAGEVVPVCTKHQDFVYSKNQFLKDKDRAFFEGSTLYIRTTNFIESKSISIDLDIILHNPNELNNLTNASYDWSSDIYPIDSSLIPIIKNEVLEKESSILNMPNDEINDFKEDEVNGRRTKG